MHEHKQRGWVFIDVLISLIILSTALLAIAYTYQHSTRSSVMARNHAEALMIAQNSLESLKEQEKTTTISLPASHTVVGESNVIYTVQYDTPVVSETLSPNLYPVEVTVSWRNFGSQSPEQILAVSTYYYTK